MTLGTVVTIHLLVDSQLHLFTFAMLLLPVSSLLLCFRRKRFNWLRSSRAGIWLLPLIPILLLKAPPFPRVFFPLFPLFVLLIAAGLRDFTAIFCRLQKRYNPKFWIGGLCILTLSWCCIQQQSELKGLFSRCCGGAGRDDFYFPYYLRYEHTPDTTAQMIAARETLKGVQAFYFTFNSDPWPLMFYLRLNGYTDADFLFDGPRGMVPALPDSTIVILKSNEDQTALAQRFKGNWTSLFKNDNHQVWSYDL